jgi:hypothetical protein
MRTGYKLRHIPTGNESAQTFDFALDALMFAERNFPHCAHQFEVTDPIEIAA